NYRGCVGAGNVFGNTQGSDPSWNLDPSNGGTLPVGPAGGMYQVTYGQGDQAASRTIRGHSGPWAPQFKVRILDATDGTSNTVFYSEGLNGTKTDPTNWGGAMGEITHGDIGGSLYNNYNPPNSNNNDAIERPCPLTPIAANPANPPINDLGYRP